MSNYPSAKDNLTESFSNSTTAEDNHPAAHNDANSAINAIQDTLGINPQGSSGTVAARMTAIETSAQVVTAGDGLDLDGDELSVDGTVIREGDSRLTDSRTPTAHTHGPEDIDADGITSGYVLTVDSGEATWAAPPEGGSGSGGGAAYTAGDGLDLDGNEFSVDSTVVRDDDARLTDQRTPSDNSVTSAKIVNGTIVNEDISASAAIAESKLNLASDAAAGTPSRRTLGTGSTQAAAGNHTHATLPSADEKAALVGTDGTPGSENKYLTESTVAASGVGTINHGSTAGAARPEGYAVVIWVGSVTPTNAESGDLRIVLED